MKSLAQIEPRTPISSAPYAITNSGSYYLTTNLTVSSGDAITIATNNVTLDLNGFTISSTAPSATNSGILLKGGFLQDSGLKNLTIANGFIQGGVTNNLGVYSGGGFGNGISFDFQIPADVLVSKVSVSGCLYNGIYLGLNGSSVESCTVRTVGGIGILASIIKNCSARLCGESAIYGDQVSDCYGQSRGAYGVSAINTALNCYGSSISSGGVIAVVAQNSRGSSSDGIGLYGITVQNCYGSSTSGTGVAGETVTGSYGESYGNGVGVNGFISDSCRGKSTGNGYGVLAFIAVNCRGFSGAGGHGVRFEEIGAMCYGFTTGTGGNYVLGAGLAGAVNLP